MKTKVLAIGTIAAAVVLAGGFAFAQSTGQGPGGFGSRGEGRMGHGMHGQMGGMHGMMGGMHGMMGGMHGMMGGGMHDNLRGRMGGMMHGGQGARFADAAEIADLKDELGITAAQEAAWTTYAKVLQDTASTLDTREGVDRDEVATMTPQERFAFVTRMREQAQARHATLAAAAKELLATLDEEQKEIAEDALPGLAAAGPGSRGARMGGHHRH